MSNVFVDVSSYQEDSFDYFNNLKSRGAIGAVIKLTEGSNPGTAYINPKASNQKKNAEAAGLQVGFYHFARYNGQQDAQNEASWFVQQLQAIGADKSAVVVADVESSDNANPATSDTQAFLNAVEGAGYTNTAVYASRSWLTSGRLDGSKFKKVWVADYNQNTSYQGWSAWQCSDNWQGLGVDVSFDSGNFFSGSPQPASQPAPQPTERAGFTDALGVYWIYEQGTFTTNTPINLRWGARTSSSVIATIPAGSDIKYDAFAFDGGYVWLRQPREDGYGYLASGTESNGKRTSYWGTFS